MIAYRAREQPEHCGALPRDVMSATEITAFARCRARLFAQSAGTSPLHVSWGLVDVCNVSVSPGLLA